MPSIARRSMQPRSSGSWHHPPGVSRLTVSIVNFNAGDFLLEALGSLRAVAAEAEMDVVVVDNASTDGSAERAALAFPQVRFLLNPTNEGFGAANNRVLREAATPHVLVLNPDTRVLPGTISHLLDFMAARTDVAAATCRLEHEDGTLDVACHRGYPTPWVSFRYLFLKDDRQYHLTDRDMSQPHEVDAIVGAFMLLQTAALRKVGYFDEDYFLYGEDLDLCYRLTQSGYRVMYVPDVRAVHSKGISSGIKQRSLDRSSATDERRVASVEHFHAAMRTFYRKHYQTRYPRLVNQLVYAGIALKLRRARKTLVV